MKKHPKDEPPRPDSGSVASKYAGLDIATAGMSAAEKAEFMEGLAKLRAERDPDGMDSDQLTEFNELLGIHSTDPAREAEGGRDTGWE